MTPVRPNSKRAKSSHAMTSHSEPTSRPTNVSEFPPQVIRLIFEHLDDEAEEEQYPQVVMQAGLVCKAFRKEVQEMFYSHLELKTHKDITEGLTEDSKAVVRSLKFFVDEDERGDAITSYDHLQSLESLTSVKSTLSSLALYPSFPGFPKLYKDTLPFVTNLMMELPVHSHAPFRPVHSVLPNVTRLTLIAEPNSIPDFLDDCSAPCVGQEELVLEMPEVTQLHVALGSRSGIPGIWVKDTLELVQCRKTRELTLTFQDGNKNKPRVLTDPEHKDWLVNWLITMPHLERLLIHIHLKQNRFINDPINLTSSDLSSLAQTLSSSLPDFKSLEFVLGSSPSLDADFDSDSDSDSNSDESDDSELEEESDDAFLRINYFEHDVMNHPREFAPARWVGSVHPYVEGEKRVVVEVDRLEWPVDPDRLTEDTETDQNMDDVDTDSEWEDDNF